MRHCASEELSLWLSDGVTQSLPLGGRDAPARQDAGLRGLDQVSTQLESWCPGSAVISYVVLSSHRASLHSVPHSHNKGLHGPHSPLPLPSEASTFIILFTEVEAEAQRGS